MDVLSEAVQVAGLERMLDELELEDNDDSLLRKVERELDCTEKHGTAQSSLQQARRYAQNFQEFLSSKGFRDAIEICAEAKLNKYLRYYYSSLRKGDGGYFAPSTLGCIRAGIHRYLTSAPVNRVIDIINGAEFCSANRMLRSMGKKFSLGSKLSD